MMIYNVEQGTEEWLALRLGKPTGSKAKDVMGSAAVRKTYLAQLATELATGQLEPSFTNAAIQHGHDTEPKARSAYITETTNFVAEVGFIVPFWNPNIGCSPDGLVGDDGMIEIKCPSKPIQHVRCFLNDAVPSDHTAQIQWNLWVTEREWCDFISYSPAMPEASQLFIKRVYRDEDYITKMAAATDKFLAELKAMVVLLNGKELPEF